MTTLRSLLIMTICGSLVGCGGFSGFSGIGSRAQNAQTENVLPFKASLDVGDEVGAFSVSVDAAGASIEEVRESVRFEGTKYCLSVNGSSDIDWALDASGEE